MKGVNLDKFVPPNKGGFVGHGEFPHNTNTADGRYLNKLEVDQWVAHGRCTRAATAASDQEINCLCKNKNAWKNAESATCYRLAEAGRGLAEPFHRLALAKAAGITPEKASNVMSRWRVLGWLVGGHKEGWTRTSGFGRDGV